MSESKKEKIRRQLNEKQHKTPNPIQPGTDRFKGFRPGKLSGGEMLLEEIIEDDSQPRQHYDEEALQELAESIKHYGVRNPIEIRWSEAENKWKVISGHRRLRASKLAGKTSVPCTIRDENFDQKMILELQIIENLQREDLLPIETAKGLKHLMEISGLSQREAGKQIGMSHMTVKRHIDLLKLPKKVQQKVEQGEVAPSVATNLLKLETPTLQNKIANKIAHNKLNRVEANHEIELHAKSKKEVKSTFASVAKKKLYWESDQLKIYGRPDFKEAELRKTLLEIANKISLSDSIS